MRKAPIIVIIFSLVLFTTDSQSQNLIINPDFKLDLNNIESSNYFGTEFGLLGWSPYFKNSKSSIDIYNLAFNENKSTLKNGVPNNRFGYHPAKSGEGYIGIGLLDLNLSTEHITGSFNEPMVKDSLYLVSYWVRFSENKSAFRCSTMEVYIADGRKNYSMEHEEFNLNSPTEFTPISLEKIMDNGSLKLILPSNSMDWELVSGVYKAKGGEQYITFGLFNMNGSKTLSKLKKYKRRYMKIFDNKYKRSRYLTKIDKKTDGFLIYNPKYEIEDWFINNSAFNACDYCYYFIDGVSVSPL